MKTRCPGQACNCTCNRQRTARWDVSGSGILVSMDAILHIADALKEACADVIATWQAAQEPCVPKTPTAVTATHRTMGQEWDASQARSIEHAEEDVHTYERDAGGIAQARRQEGHVRGLWLAARHRLPLRGLWRAAHHRLPRCSEVCLTACGTRAAHWVRVRVTLGLPLKAPVGVEVRAEQGGPCR